MSADHLYLVQLLLPLYDNQDNPFPASHYEQLSRELTERFGGLTAYTRAPAEGRWREEGAPAQRDDVVIYEVMAESLDRDWWREFRLGLERRFAQDELVVRAHPVERL